MKRSCFVLSRLECLGVILRVFLFIAVIGEDDLLHQSVPHDIPLGEMMDTDTLDAIENLHGGGKTALFAERQVGLREVAGDDRL